jgi:hypothetical protein
MFSFIPFLFKLGEIMIRFEVQPFVVDIDIEVVPHFLFHLFQFIDSLLNFPENEVGYVVICTHQALKLVLVLPSIEANTGYPLLDCQFLGVFDQRDITKIREDVGAFIPMMIGVTEVALIEDSLIVMIKFEFILQQSKVFPQISEFQQLLLDLLLVQEVKS